ncbi:MAG: hypothetical protein IPK35_14600 [Saprospiraceae bacterium]|jgi:hypothetical protein|nr:hypothetical protein [Saprospiraceae bacterium]
MEGIDNIGRTTPSELQLDSTAVSHLKETAKWAKFLSIVGMVMMGIIVLIGIIMMVSIGSISSLSPELGNLGGMGAGLGFVYLILAGIYAYPIWKLYGFSNLTKKALGTNDSTLLTQAFGAQKSMFKFMGFFTAILLGIYALIIVLGFLGFLFMDLRQ